jgi:hypothetical protein
MNTDVPATTANEAGFQIEKVALKMTTEEFVVWLKKKNYPASFNDEIIYKTFHYGTEEQFIAIFDLFPEQKDNYSYYIKRCYNFYYNDHKTTHTRFKILEFLKSEGFFSHSDELNLERAKKTDIGNRIIELQNLLYQDSSDPIDVSSPEDQKLLQHLRSSEFIDEYSLEIDMRYKKFGMKFTEEQKEQLRASIKGYEEIIAKYKFLLE